MTMKKLLKFLGVLMLGVLVYSCAKDGTEPNGDTGGVTIGFKVEGEASYDLYDRYEDIVYTATVSFPEGRADYVSPKVEFDMNELLEINRAGIILTSPDGSNTTYRTITVEDSKITVEFDDDLSQSFGYLDGADYTITVRAMVSESVTDDELAEYAETGLASTVKFTDTGKSAGPVEVKVFPLYEGLEDLMQGVTLDLDVVVGAGGTVMHERDDKLAYTASLGTTVRSISWRRARLEFTLDEVLEVKPANVTLTNQEGTVLGSDWMDVTVDGNLVVVRFKVFPSRNDLFKVEVRPTVKNSVTTASLNQAGHFDVEVDLLVDNAEAEEIPQADPAEVTVDIEPFVFPRTDMYDYPYKMNIVYFIPTDVTPNPGYRRRLSRMLIGMQNFVHYWTQHWGFGDRSFGLPYREDGMIDIVTVYGTRPVSEYPYSSEIGAPNMIADINAHYEANNLVRNNDHILVIGCSNIPNGSPNYPFYGLGKWCFAVDFPGMDENLATYQVSALPGGMMHEAGHGMLDLPHVGPSWSEMQNPDLGMTLMGAGNMSYGKSPTFFHPASAATMIATQLGAREQGTFYASSTVTINPPTVVDHGDGTCTVSGTFTSNRTVNHVVVRFYNGAEDFLGGSSGYTSVAKVAENNDGSYETTFDILDLRGQGGPVSGHKTVKLGITILNTNGSTNNMTAVSVWELVNDGGTWTMVSETLDRTGWTVTASQNPLTLDPGGTGIPNNTANLVDESGSSFLSMVKAGLGYGGVSVPLGTEIWSIIDMKQATTFKTIRLQYRTDNGSRAMRNGAVVLYTSDDNVNWALLKDAELNTASLTNYITFDSPVTCRYLKMIWDDYDASDPGAACLGFSDLSLMNK